MYDLPWKVEESIEWDEEEMIEVEDEPEFDDEYVQEMIGEDPEPYEIKNPDWENRSGSGYINVLYAADVAREEALKKEKEEAGG